MILFDDLKPFMQRSRGFALAISAALVSVALMYQHPRILAPVNHAIYDNLIRTRMSGDSANLSVIIDIDQKTVQKYAQYPLPRYAIADLIRRLNSYGVSAIGIDMDFSDPDISSPNRVRDGLRQHKNIPADFVNIPQKLRDYDKYLADVAADAGNVVFGIYSSPFQTDAPVTVPEGRGASYRTNFFSRNTKYAPRIHEIKSPRFPVASLSNAASVGIAYLRADIDGVVRRVPLLVRIGDVIYPSLALEVFRIHQGAERMTFNVGRGGVESIRVGNYMTPVGNFGRIRFPFAAREYRPEYISFADVMEGRVDAEKLRGKIAFVGSSAIVSTDKVATPFEEFHPTLSLHMATIDAMVLQNGIRVPQIMRTIRPIAVVMLIFLLGFLQQKLSLGAYSVATFGIGGALVFASWIFIRGGYFISPTYFLFALIYMLAGHLIIVAVKSRWERNMLYRTFSRYISPSIVKKLSKFSPESLDGEEKEVSIMFSDIHRFSRISENMLPKDVVRLLNNYFSFMATRIEKNDGVLDKLVGDGILSFWNAPVKLSEHQRHAVRTALEIQNSMGVLNEGIQKEFGIDISIGISIHCSAVFIGSIGSHQRSDYTIIGDGVNLASRLEGLCKVYGVGVIVSEYIRSSASGDEFIFRYIDNVRVHGRNASIKIYEPLLASDAEKILPELKKWGRFIDLYNSGAFSAALEILKDIMAGNPSSRLYALYMHRVLELIKNPPQTWSGIWYFDNK